jgi:aminodeoxyfutalosine synthase
MTSVLERVSEKLASGSGLTPGDIDALWASPDLVTLGLLADESRRRRHGDRATFVRVADVRCDEPWDGVPPFAGEVRIVGSPDSFDRALRLVEQAAAGSGGIPVTAFSLADLERLAGEARALRAMVEAVLESGAAALAEAPVDVLTHPRRALEAALEAGASVARFTVHRAFVAAPQEVLGQVRALQKATGAVRAFAPLPRAGDGSRPSTGYDDVKLVALARLALEQVATVQVDWALYGPKLAQVALLFGADDLDAVSPVDDAPEGRRRAPLEEVLRNIRAASLSPVERDGRFAVRAP